MSYLMKYKFAKRPNIIKPYDGDQIVNIFLSKMIRNHNQKLIFFKK